MKTKFGMYPEYHTSDDKLGTVVTKKGLFQSYEMLKKMILIIENDDKIQSNFIGEPQLSKRNLYPHLSFGEGLYETKFTQNTFNLLTYADGEKSLLEIAEKLNVPCWELFDVKNILIKKKLIKYKKILMQINHFVSSSLEENVDIKNLNYFLYENDLNIIKKKTNNLNYKLVKPFFMIVNLKKHQLIKLVN